MADVQINEARIDKVVRVNGKKEATMLVTIPAAQSANIPLGEVSLLIETKQIGMFDRKEPIRGVGPRAKEKAGAGKRG